MVFLFHHNILIDYLIKVKKLLIIEDNIYNGGIAEKVSSLLNNNKPTSYERVAK